MLDKQISSIKEQLNLLPPGKLVCSQNGEYQKWYQSDGHKKIYIPKANKQLAEQLATKKYLSLLLEDLENEKKAIQSYLRHSSFHGKSEKLLTDDSEYKQLSETKERTNTSCEIWVWAIIFSLYAQNSTSHFKKIQK